MVRHRQSNSTKNLIDEQHFLRVAKKQLQEEGIPIHFANEDLEEILKTGMSIGEGGFGKVFSVPRPPNLRIDKSTVAVKYISASQVAHQIGHGADNEHQYHIEHLCRLMVRNLAMCMKGIQNDPHVLPIYDIRLTTTQPGLLITMEHMERTTIEHATQAFKNLYGKEWQTHLQAIRRNEIGKIDMTEYGDLFIEIFSHILQGVKTLHQYGMHVRDFKFNNVFVDGPLRAPTHVKIGDLDTLGILASEFKGGKEGMTTALDQSGKIIGTAQFMPDELLLGIQTMSDISGIRWDAYALGSNILAFLGEEIQTGEGNIMTRLATRNRWRQRPLRKVVQSAFGEKYRDLAHIIWRATEINPDLQYHAIEEMQEDVARLQEGKSLLSGQIKKYFHIWRRHKDVPDIIGKKGISRKTKIGIATGLGLTILGVGAIDYVLYKTSLVSYAREVAKHTTPTTLQAFEKKAADILLKDVRETHIQEIKKGSREVFPYGQYYGEPFTYFDGTVIRSGDFLQALYLTSNIPEHHREAMDLFAQYALQQKIVMQDEGVGDLNSPVGLTRFQAGTLVEPHRHSQTELSLETKIGISYARGMSAIAARIILGMFEEKTGTFSWKRDPEYQKQTLPDGKTIVGTGVHHLYQTAVIPFLCDLDGTIILSAALSGDIEKIISMATEEYPESRNTVETLLREQATILESEVFFQTPISKEKYWDILQRAAETHAKILTRENTPEPGMRSYARGVIGSDGSLYQLLAYSDEPGAGDLTGNTASEKTQRHLGILLGTAKARNTLFAHNRRSSLLDNIIIGLFEEYAIQSQSMQDLPPERWRVAKPALEHTQADTYAAILSLLAVQEMTEEEMKRNGYDKSQILEKITKTIYEKAPFRRHDWFYRTQRFSFGLIGEQVGERATIRGNLIRGDAALLNATVRSKKQMEKNQ